MSILGKLMNIFPFLVKYNHEIRPVENKYF